MLLALVCVVYSRGYCPPLHRDHGTPSRDRQLPSIDLDSQVLCTQGETRVYALCAVGDRHDVL